MNNFIYRSWLISLNRENPETGLLKEGYEVAQFKADDLVAWMIAGKKFNLRLNAVEG